MTDHAPRRVLPTLGLNELRLKLMGHLEARLRRAREAREYGDLASLPDHLLEDVGVSRDEAMRLARGGAPDRR